MAVSAFVYIIHQRNTTKTRHCTGNSAWSAVALTGCRNFKMEVDGIDHVGVFFFSLPLCCFYDCHAKETFLFCCGSNSLFKIGCLREGCGTSV